MADEDSNPALDDFVKRLVDETGITEGQALELIWLIGLNWTSLIREARALGSQDSQAKL